jgi:hypothetical protein
MEVREDSILKQKQEVLLGCDGLVVSTMALDPLKGNVQNMVTGMFLLRVFVHYAL